MSHKSQSANMATLSKLLQPDLGYIYGPKESRPNGAKSEFLSKGRAFMTALGRDLGFLSQEVRVNNGGIAVSGEVYLTGFWEQNSGLYLWLEQDLMGAHSICYRTITVKQGIQPVSLRQKTGRQLEHGRNHYISVDFLAKGDYSALLGKLLEMKGECYAQQAA